MSFTTQEPSTSRTPADEAMENEEASQSNTDDRLSHMVLWVVSSPRPRLASRAMHYAIGHPAYGGMDMRDHARIAGVTVERFAQDVERFVIDFGMARAIPAKTKTEIYKLTNRRISTKHKE